MFFIAPAVSGNPVYEKGIFLSAEMSKRLLNEVNEGKLSFSEDMVPVHLPWDGLVQMNFGSHDHLRINEDDWRSLNLPLKYPGGSLEEKKVVVFPMHGLGDQLYLAAALKHLAAQYNNVSFDIVRPSIQSADQWYDHIYSDDCFSITGPVVNAEKMAVYDYYVDAEFFAHLKEYEGSYPPFFYGKVMFCHEDNEFNHLLPSIKPVDPVRCSSAREIDDLFTRLKKRNRPVVFVNPATTGRVRDIPVRAVLEFISLSVSDFSLIVSTFNNRELENEIINLNPEAVASTASYIKGVDDLIYILSMSDYIITSDSGITHLGEALGIPTGSVFNVVTPEERTGPYRFSEQLNVEFTIDGVCETPCYVHALDDSELCPGMKWLNQQEGVNVLRQYAPCMENFSGEYLLLLLQSLKEQFSETIIGNETGTDKTGIGD